MISNPACYRNRNLETSHQDLRLLIHDLCSALVSYRTTEAEVSASYCSYWLQHWGAVLGADICVSVLPCVSVVVLLMYAIGPCEGTTVLYWAIWTIVALRSLSSYRHNASNKAIAFCIGFFWSSCPEWLKLAFFFFFFINTIRQRNVRTHVLPK